MYFSTLSTFSLLALASTATACVQFSATLTNGRFTAALTDNGGQTCQVNEGAGSGVQDYQLSCIGDYHADININSGIVNYSYGSFSGSFGTSHSHTEYLFDPPIDRWTANVWGC